MGTMAMGTTGGFSNPPTDGDLAVQPLLCAPEAVERTRGNASEAASVDMYSSADSWRAEVAARLERYRTRRKPRTPRYPSLFLPFDSPEIWARTAPPPRAADKSAAVMSARDGQDSTFVTNEEETALLEPLSADSRSTPEQSAKVIEFPRSAAIPVFHPTELADPIFSFDRPRIVEAPEILPPPPALGGMLIEPAHQETGDPRSDVYPVIPSASIIRRVLAALVDGVILATALSGVAAIFFRLNPLRLHPLRLNPAGGPLPLLAGATLAAGLAAVALLLWMAYEFFFVVYTGSTPGLRAARLRLAGFDGSPLNRRVRRWRVLASFLSMFSAALGYLWCVLDRDGLCWHDRITRTHVQPAGQPE